MRTFVLILFACAASSSSFAQAFVSGSLGWNDTHVRCQVTYSVLGANDLTSCRNDRVSGVARLGYQWSNGLGIELSLMSFGRASATTFNPLFDHQANHAFGADSYVHTLDTYRSRTQAIALTRAFALSDVSSIDLKLGWARTRTLLDVCPVLNIQPPANLCIRSAHSPREAVYWGLGLTHRIGTSTFGVLSLDRVPMGRLDRLAMTAVVPSSRSHAAVATLGVKQAF